MSLPEPQQALSLILWVAKPAGARQQHPHKVTATPPHLGVREEEEGEHVVAVQGPPLLRQQLHLSRARTAGFGSGALHPLFTPLLGTGTKGIS